ncbi:putative GntR-family transcriptional regulator [Streptomyces sp. Tu6071]|nr:putative GntR-family transcriptional regulator [Streptomyces sp. Tu6071]
MGLPQPGERPAQDAYLRVAHLQPAAVDGRRLDGLARGRDGEGQVDAAAGQQDAHVDGLGPQAPAVHADDGLAHGGDEGFGGEAEGVDPHLGRGERPYEAGAERDERGARFGGAAARALAVVAGLRDARRDALRGVAEQALGAQRLERLAHPAALDAELLRQLRLGGDAVARLEHAARDAVAKGGGDGGGGGGQGVRRGRRGAERCGRR